MLKIDAFPHVLPRPYLELARPRARGRLARLFDYYESLTALHDLDRRFRVMDELGEYLQVLTLVQPAVDAFGQGTVAADLARCANDSMAELCRRHPDRFVGFAAAIALSDVGGALAEVDRAVGELGALGVQIHTNIFAERFGKGLDFSEPMGLDLDGAGDPAARQALLVDQLKHFYGDTALSGARHAIECGLGFFGPERLLFGTDMPFDLDGGPGYVRGAVRALDAMDLSDDHRQMIYEGNARRLLNLPG